MGNSPPVGRMQPMSKFNVAREAPRRKKPLSCEARRGKIIWMNIIYTLARVTGAARDKNHNTAHRGK